MRTGSLILKSCMLIIIIMTSYACKNNDVLLQTEDSFSILTGKYMGQNEPGLVSEIFAPNIISTGMAEINSVFSPDYNEFYFSIRLPDGKLVIMQMNYDGSQWSEPEVASFSGEYSDADPFFSSDGQWLYYISTRPVDSTKQARKDFDIWRVQKDGDAWMEPERLGGGINTDASETYPSLTKDGKLYFSSGRIGNNNKDIYYAEKADEGFSAPIRLSDTVNSHWEGDIYVSPDEDYMIFGSYGRDAGPGLYITFRENGHWDFPKRMSDDINATGREFCPIVSPDGKYFFYTSNRVSESKDSSGKLTFKLIKDRYTESCKNPQMGKTDLYWVSSDIIEEYRDE